MKRKALIIARHTKFMTQADVAKELGVSACFYGMMELGTRKISLENGKILANLLKIKIENL